MTGLFRATILNRLERSPIALRLAKGMFWATAGSLISRSLMLLASILLARILDTRGFGELGMIRSTVAMFGIFADFGLGLTATKYVAEFRRTDPARAGRIIALSQLFAAGCGAVTAVGLFTFAPWLAEHTINAPHLAGTLRIGALILFITALSGTQNGALFGFEAFKTIAYVNLCVGLISFPSLVCGAYLGGLNGVVWALAGTVGINWVLNQIALRKEARRNGVPLKFAGFRQESAILWKFSLPAVAAAGLYTPVTWACSAMLASRPGGYVEMGLFNGANQWFALVIFLPSLLGNVVLPVISERLGQNDTRQSMRTMLLGVKVNALVVTPIILVASIASPLVMSLYGNGFRRGWPTMVVLLLTAGLVACETPITQVLAASGRMWIGLGMNIVWATAFFVATWMLVGFGAFGLATAMAIAFLVQSVTIVAFAISILRRV